MSRQRLRVELARSGGVAGITLRTSLDTGDLAAEEAAEIERLLAGAGAVSPPSSGAAQPGGGGADRFSYELTVVGGEERRTVWLREQDLAPGARRVLDRLLATRR